MNPEWFYSEGDVRKGPVTLDELKRLYQDGQLRPNDLVWKAGMADWTEVRLVEEVVGPITRVVPESTNTDGDDEFDRPNRRRRRTNDDYRDDTDDRPSTRRDRDRDERRRRRDEDDHPGDDELADYDDSPRRRRRPSGGRQPQQINTVGIMFLIGGILGLLTVFGVGVGSMGFCCLWPGYLLELIWAIFAIIRGSAMMNVDEQAPPRTLAILQICMILNLDIINCILGIVALTQLNDPAVSAYYRRRGYY